MRKFTAITLFLLCIFALKANTNQSYTEVVNGVEFDMVYVEGGNLKSSKFEYQLENYHISATEVTQELWEAVMGTTVAMQRDKINPQMPLAGVGDKYPIYYVSQKEAKEFCERLSRLTGRKYSLPIWQQWEYAALGGNKSHGYKYSGSDNANDVAWINSESTHPVATKAPNELGIYDMSGNVYEWCDGDGQLRGGSWMCDASCAECNNVNTRDSRSRDKIVGFRVVENTSYRTRVIDGKDFTTTINGVSFKMVFVEGGTFQMGAQKENPNGANYDSEAYGDESPVHNVTLSDYYIGETEVTQELWEAVMGYNPSHFKGSNNPVEYVSWDDCQEFITKLNLLTRKTFCLPTEAEWEYAARGGKKSQGYKYSGSNDVYEVAWYWLNSSKREYILGINMYVEYTNPVGTKSSNELGIYDMSGNVREWCSDWYGDYSSSSQTNPTGPTSGSDRVLRGGGCDDRAQSCRVVNRIGCSPGDRRSDNCEIGFRLALRP